jgi:ATP-binding cassette subfamily B protein
MMPAAAAAAAATQPAGAGAPLLSESQLALLWPVSRLGELMQALASRMGLVVQPGRLAPSPPDVDTYGIGCWLETAGASLGLDTEALTFGYAEVEPQLAALTPGLVRIPGPGEPHFLAILGGRRGRVQVLTPELRVRRVAAGELAAMIRREKEKPLADRAARILESACVPARRRARVLTALVTEQLSSEVFSGCWLLRVDPAAGFHRQLAQARLYRRVWLLAGAHAAEYGLWILAWWVAGLGAMQGRLDRGWLFAWVLLLLTVAPIRAWGTWLQGCLAIAGGAILKRRLLLGALRLDPDRVRLEGAGQMLGRVLESEAVESLALSGGFLALVAAIELVFAFAVLAVGAAPFVQTALLAGWSAATVILAIRYIQRNALWTSTRLGMTNDLVERMIGHRTRLAQEESRQWHAEEDEELERYALASRQVDRAGAILAALVPRGWLLLGIAGLGETFVAGTASPAGLAVSIGGVLLGYRAFKRLTAGLWPLAGAFVAWRWAAPLFHAAEQVDGRGSPEFSVRTAAPSAVPVVQAHDLVFRYRERGEAVLRGCSVSIRSGDRVLLEGNSGCGKSTLAALLSGLRRPESGLLLAGGLDHHTLGNDGWRRRIAAAPQFHENHVLSGTFAFNLLMGRRWPPTGQDIAQAESLCRDLGLDAVLERMPSGLMQMVGECGWQLSHGEQSRLFIARALLQDADLVILDESFGALDPETMRRALACVLARARALLVIAHN